MPPGTRRVQTACNACGKPFIASISVGAAGQEGQSGRYRNMAGGRADGRTHGIDCSCSASQRRLVVRHPLQQIEQLISDTQGRLAAGA